MNHQQTSIKHSALGWVKKSIDDNLSEIETDLKQYIEADEEELLQRVKERLSVIQGVLMMIEQYGAAMLTEEMVALVDFITESKQDKREQALEVMLRAVLQLPDYLERLQAGSRDVPPDFNVHILDDAPNREPTIFRSKAVGEPPLMLAISVWLAIRDAVAGIADHRLHVALDAPATPERVLMAVEDIRARAANKAAAE